jgi:hypothetical protein
MSQLKYCQGPECHTYRTKDRIRGPKGDKHYETRKRSSFYYGKSNFCSLNCQNDWFNKFGDMAVNHFGRVTEAKRADCDSAWYKDYTWGRNGNHDHYIKNDLLGRRISITQAQYNNCDTNNIKDLVRPN